jgi:iron(III) transport system permease protein
VTSSGGQPWARLVGAPSAPALLGVALLVLVGWLVVPPTLVLVYGSLTSTPPGAPPEFTLALLARAYGRAAVFASLGNSVVYAVSTATGALVIGGFLAWLVERTDTRVRSWTDAFTLVPLLIPAVLLVSGWMLLLAPRDGLVNQALRRALGPGAAGLNLFSFPGMVWVGTLQELPLAFLWLWPSFRAMNPALEEAALVSGAGTWTTLRRITLPLIRPTLIAAWIIFFITSLGGLAVPLLIGLPAGIFLYSTEIFLATTRVPTNLNLASAYCLLLLAVSGVGIWAHRVASAEAGRFVTVTGRGYRARRIRLGRWRAAATAAAVLLLAVTAGLPLLVLVWNAFMPYPQVPSLEGLGRATLRNFPSALGYGPATRAVLNSLLLGLGAGVITTALGGLVAWGLLRQRSERRLFGALDLLCMAPVAIPGLIVGVSLVWLYLVLPVPVYGTPWILLIAYVTLHLPYAVRIVSSGLGQIHPELEEAALVAGASRAANLRRIVMPLIAPALAVSVVYITIRAFREYAASIFLTSVGSEVFSVIVLDMWEGGNSTILAAYATVVIAGLSLASGVLYWIGRRSGIRV